MKISLIKVALGLAAILNACLAILNLLYSQGAPCVTWGLGNALAHDAFYEKIWGLNTAVYAAFFVILLLATTGKAQAKATIYLGGLGILYFVGLYSVVLNEVGVRISLGDLAPVVIISSIFPLVAGLLEMKKPN